MTGKTNGVDIYVGAQLRLARIEAGLSVSALADEAGLGELMLARYERGGARMPAAVLCNLSETLGKPLSYFFDEIRSRQD